MKRMQFICLRVVGQASNGFDHAQPTIDLVQDTECILDGPFGQ